MALVRLIVFILLPSFAGMGLFAQGETEEDVISVDSTVVFLNAIIKDTEGRHVSGLKESQFKVFENGVEQQIAHFSSEETPFAAVILLDTSGSMGQNVSLARSAAIKFLDGIRVSDHVAIYRFDSRVTLVQDFSNSRDVSHRIFDLKAYGMTVLNDAIIKAAEVLADRPEKRRAIIVLSDGADTQSRRSASRALKAALEVNAVIYTVDMTPQNAPATEIRRNQGVLKNFAEQSGGTFVATPGGVAMRDEFEKIVEELGDQYTLGYHPIDAAKDGKWRSIELRIARPNLTIRTRKGYTAERSK